MTSRVCCEVYHEYIDKYYSRPNINIEPPIDVVRVKVSND